MLNKIKEIPINDILPDASQPRKTFDEVKLQELAESIKQHGLLQPILVRPLQNGRFQIIHGERRWRACKLAGKTTTRAEVKDLNDKEALEIQLTENLQREDLNPIEEAETFQRMIEALGYTHEQIASKIGKSREYVTNKLRLLKLPVEIQGEIKKGNITESHARLMLSLNESEKQKQLAEKVIHEEMSVKETEQLLRSLNKVSCETYVSSGIEKIPLLISFDPHVYYALERVSNEKRLSKESIVSNLVSNFLQKEGYLRRENLNQMTRKVVECE